jgi:hypothetical protein
LDRENTSSGPDAAGISPTAFFEALVFAGLVMSGAGFVEKWSIQPPYVKLFT